MLELTRVPGREGKTVVLYALSTCGWCAKTKRLLSELGVAYSYVDVDLLTGAASAEAVAEVERWNPAGSFPTIVIDDRTAVLGYNPERLREALA